MKMTLNTRHVANILLADSNANWSREGALALAEHLEELEDSTGEELELDACAIRCEYSEYSSLTEWICDYYGETLDKALESAGIDIEEDDDEDTIEDLIRSHVEDHGQLIEFSGGIIVSNF